MDTQDLRFDVIIVGSGPGGATVAKELSGRGKKTLLLEWGSGEAIGASYLKRLWQAARWLGWPGKGLLVTRGFLAMVRGICKGGSSVYYYATCFKVPHGMMKKHGIDITAEEKETRKELPINPLTDEMMTPMARRIMESARSLGIDWKRLDKFMDTAKWKPGYPFGYFGDPGPVKWSARMYVDEAVRNGAVFLDRARVSRVIVSGGAAQGVEFRRGGRTQRAFADRIVIAAGGIGTPVILRASGIREAGYDFFFDPLVTAAGIVDDVRARDDEIPMSAGFHNEKDGYVMTDMPLPRELDMAMAAEVFRFHRIFSGKKTLRIMIKARDSLGGRLTDGGGVRKGLASADKASLLKGYEQAREILKKAGARGIYRTWYFAAHPGGTVKIGHLLDSNLKTGIDNLYVCDCSVIPEPWGLPPVLTLICLGKRLAKHLAGEGAKKRVKKAAPKKAGAAGKNRKKAR